MRSVVNWDIFQLLPPLKGSGLALTHVGTCQTLLISLTTESFHLSLPKRQPSNHLIPAQICFPLPSSPSLSLLLTRLSHSWSTISPHLSISRVGFARQWLRGSWSLPLVFATARVVTRLHPAVQISGYLLAVSSGQGKRWVTYDPGVGLKVMGLQEPPGWYILALSVSNWYKKELGGSIWP